jgi:hypothetical protein
MSRYYDYVLAFIPLALLGVTAALGAAGVAPRVAVSAGGGVAALGVVHALFVNGPSNAVSAGRDASMVDAD